jgi:membrane-associated phospholipid phosphatase
MLLINRLQSFVEKTFFGGKSSKASEAIVYIAVNLFLMLVVFDVLLNTIVYDWVGALYSKGFHLNTALDNIIPFKPEWAIFYLYLFYWATEATMAIFAILFYKRGYALAWSFVVINLIADLVYLVFPVTTDIYRAAIAVHPIVGNKFADAMYAHYTKDPSFDCFPSLHAALSVIIFYAWYRFCRDRRNVFTIAVAVLAFVIAAGTVLSTLFVKQHYIADEIAGIALAWAVGKLVYDRLARSATQRNGEETENRAGG